MRLRRFWQDGTAAPEFGNGQGIDTDLDLHFSMSTLLVDPQARPILVGTMLEPAKFYTRHFAYAPPPINPGYATLVRFDGHGQRDASFGDGDGVVQHDLD